MRDEAWDALHLVYLMGSGLFGLLSREYAPWSERGAAFLARLEGLPALARQAIIGLTGLPGRPVALLQVDTALAQLAGIDELVEAGAAEARSRAAAGEAADLVTPIEGAAAEARAAIASFRALLETEVRARASGEGRLGPELFARKLRLTLSSDLSPEELRERAWSAYHAVRAEMVRLARLAWPTWIPEEPLPEVSDGDAATEASLVRRVLDAIATEHQAPEGLIDFCQAEIERISGFCREHDVITLPDEPLTITWTPVFLRAHARAFLDSPGRLDRGLKSHFWITPPDESQGPEAIESYLREENDRMLRDLAIHEAIPGHYLQLAASNRCPSLARTVFTNGLFAEGWAVYVTQVMVDLGYGADDPAYVLTHWKLYLRAVVNAILDVETHAGSMTEQEALDLMVRGAWQEPDEARGQVAPGAHQLDAAVDVLRGLAGDVGPRDGDAPSGRRGRRRHGRRRARPARGRRPRRHARLRPACAPRGRHRARHAGHQVGAGASCSARSLERATASLAAATTRVGATAPGRRHRGRAAVTSRAGCHPAPPGHAADLRRGQLSTSCPSSGSPSSRGPATALTAATRRCHAGPPRPGRAGSRPSRAHARRWRMAIAPVVRPPRPSHRPGPAAGAARLGEGPGRDRPVGRPCLRRPAPRPGAPHRGRDAPLPGAARAPRAPRLRHRGRAGRAAPLRAADSPR